MYRLTPRLFVIYCSLLFVASCSSDDFLDNNAPNSNFTNLIIPKDDNNNSIKDTTSSVVFPVGESDNSETIPKVTFQTIMKLENNQSPHPQGGACWEDYFFQFSNENRIVRIYDLDQKKLLQTYQLEEKDRGFVPNCHCNSVCFGSEFYSTSDEFPLLYVSTGYAKNGYSGALAYRILKNKGEFSLSLVQTLRFPSFNGVSWTEYIPSSNSSFLCCGNAVYVIPSPSFKEGDIIITQKDTVETIILPKRPEWISSSRGQGHLYYEGRILLTAGVPQTGEESVLLDYNLEKRRLEAIINFKDLGIHSESESIFFWNNHLCIAFTDKIISLITKDFNLF